MSCELRRIPIAVSDPAPGGTPASRLADHRIIALARAACAPKASLRRPFLRGRWRAAHILRVAAATVALGIQRGEIAAPDIAAAERSIADRLAHLLAQAPTLTDDLNSLAEFIGGRASSHPDRLHLVVTHASTGLRTRQRAPPATR
jgi:hypothetical protein